MKWILIAVSVVAGLIVVVLAIGAMLPKAHVVSRSSKFNQPPQAVWDIITGPPNWRPDIQSFEQLPPRDGHRVWKEVDKHRQSIRYESIEESPPSRLVTRIADPTLPFGGTWTHEIQADGAGSRLTITENGEIYNPIFRFMARYVIGYHGTLEAYLKALHDKLGDASGD